MAIEGWYYLHTNGDLIYKRALPGTDADIRESDFATAIWPFDPTDRAGAWTILIEGLAAGAKGHRVDELAAKWKCDDADAVNLAGHFGISIDRDGNEWRANRSDFVNLQESPAGFGVTCLRAFADLAKAVGYKPSKMWGRGFRELVG